jgi:hypothetical protein
VQITIDLPDEIASTIQEKWHNFPRKVLECLAIEAYRQGVITSAQVGRMLHLSSRYEVDGFLKHPLNPTQRRAHILSLEPNPNAICASLYSLRYRTFSPFNLTQRAITLSPFNPTLTLAIALRFTIRSTEYSIHLPVLWMVQETLMLK